MPRSIDLFNSGVDNMLMHISRPFTRKATMNIVLGNKQYGIHFTTYRWGFACHIEFKGETYGGSWAL